MLEIVWNADRPVCDYKCVLSGPGPAINHVRAPQLFSSKTKTTILFVNVRRIVAGCKNHRVRRNVVIFKGINAQIVAGRSSVGSTGSTTLFFLPGFGVRVVLDEELQARKKKEFRVCAGVKQTLLACGLSSLHTLRKRERE